MKRDCVKQLINGYLYYKHLLTLLNFLKHFDDP